MRPVFCGNFEYETRQSELERLFSKYGRIERVDMKSGIAFLSTFSRFRLLFLIFLVFLGHKVAEILCIGP